jgi:tetratricopeptide (TPR) repeat protein
MSIDSTLTRRMTSARAVRPKKEFVPAILPWVIAGAALLIYLLTLNHWVSQSSLTRTARVSGWLWQPEALEPFYWLVTYPIHWLPAGLIPIALNLFSAVCGTLTLALLARSVALLPHDRTEAQRNREKDALGVLTTRFAWVPPAVAALVCGLQLSFWENATVASVEILNLLLFAYIIRCLLEYRMDSRESWLFRASVIYGAAMANNWAMIAFFPVFLVALVWLRGVSFFNTRFLLRMFLLGVAGLSLYLLLPLVALVTGNKDMNFWQALKANLGTQGLWVRSSFALSRLFRGEQPFWVLALPSLFPIVALSFRWPAYFGDPSRLGVALTTFILHFMHGVLLMLCLWVALDPAKFGPRHLFGQTYSQNLFPMLTLYYLGALSIGYFVGYFLLVFGAEPIGRPRTISNFTRLCNQLVVGGLSVFLVATAVLLVLRNVPQIQATNGPMLRLYARSLTERLPSKGAVTLSDFSQQEQTRMLLAQADLAQQGRSDAYLMLNTEWLYWPSYHRSLKQRYGSRWPFDLPAGRKAPSRFGDQDVWSVIVLLSKTNQVYYLHPSFGYFFETFYLEPHGLVYKFDQYPTNTLVAPKLDKETIDENEAFWTRTDEFTIKPLLQASAGTAAHQGWLERVEHRLHLTREPNPTAAALSSFYSLALNYWGVQLQRSGRIVEAAARFQRALDLNPDNLVAEVNLECNRNLQSSKPAQIQLTKGTIDRLASRYRGRWEGETLEAVMNDCGPFDEPVFCYKMGGLWGFPPFGLRPQFRQAALNFTRAADLMPNALEPRLRLAETCVYANLPDESLKIIDEIHARADQLGINRTNEPMVLAVTLAAHLSKADIESAKRAVQSALQKDPDNFDLLSAASRMYITYRYYSNALESIDAQLKVRPSDPNVLYAKGLSQLGIKQPESAIATFSHVLEIETNRLTELSYVAKCYRAQAFTESGKLNEAQADYEALQKDFPLEHGLYRALADLFYTKKDTNAAIRNYQLYKAGMTNADELKFVNARLKELKPGTH